MSDAQVIPFPNPDEVSPSNTEPRRFFVEDRRFYIVHAEDEEAAFDAYCEMSEEEASACAVEGGGVEVYAADN